jgi:hypothetical protein
VHLPPKGWMRGQTLKRPTDIAWVVACKAEFGTGFHHARQRVQDCRLHETPFVMALLRPWIGKEDKDAPQSAVAKSLDDIACVAHVESHSLAQILTGFVREFRKHLCDSCLVRFGANEADARMCECLPQHMLAAADADLKPHFFDAGGESGSRIKIARELKRETRKQVSFEFFLPSRELWSLAPAIKESAPAALGSARG